MTVLLKKRSARRKICPVLSFCFHYIEYCKASECMFWNPDPKNDNYGTCVFKECLNFIGVKLNKLCEVKK
jgi:hypothetical protein